MKLAGHIRNRRSAQKIDQHSSTKPRQETGNQETERQRSAAAERCKAREVKALEKRFDRSAETPSYSPKTGPGIIGASIDSLVLNGIFISVDAIK